LVNINVDLKQIVLKTNKELTSMSKNRPYRLNRMFSSKGRCFDVAIDHGFFNEYTFLQGIENIQKAIQTIVDANPDCIQLSTGQAHFLQSIPGKHKPGLVLRADAANVYGPELPKYLFSETIKNTIEQAVKLDAVAVCINLLLLPNQPELHHQCVRNISLLKYEAERYGMTLMVEPLVMLPNEVKGGYMVDGDITKIMPLVRQAVELGADVIKADPCDDVREYHRVIEVASGVPVLVRGGGRASDEELVHRTVELMRQGASGIVYGRNIVQHPNPSAMTRAMMEIVHNDASVETALAILRGESV
jgi:DhnA family fructose-bisphosphate aldolase class Ia